jgi:hypothetical protein
VHSVLGKELVEVTMRALFPCLVLLACGPKDIPADTDTDADADTDADTDSDTDADTDSDADTDTTETGTTDTGTTDTGIVREDDWLFDEDHALALSDDSGVRLLRSDGSVQMLVTWAEIDPDHSSFAGGPLNPDGDGLLLTFLNASGGEGGIARVDAAGQIDFSLEGLSQPLGVVRDPADDTLILAEGFRESLIWIAGDGSSRQPVRVLDSSQPGWDLRLPTGLSRIDADDGHTYLLVSSLSSYEDSSLGKIALWDITDPEALSLVWDFPSEGGLLYAHSPILRRYEGQWWLLYAHGMGLPEGGSVGLAVTSSLTQEPQYVADLQPAGLPDPVPFLTGVEFTSDGWLYLTDIGFTRVLKAPMVEGLAPTGATGAYDQDQVVVDLPGVELVIDELSSPFEAKLWELPQ